MDTNNRADDVVVVEDWTYEVDGKTISGRQVWHVDPPGPKGSGVLFHVTRYKDAVSDDGMWERHVYEWKRCAGMDNGASRCNCNPTFDVVEVQ